MANAIRFGIYNLLFTALIFSFAKAQQQVSYTGLNGAKNTASVKMWYANGFTAENDEIVLGNNIKEVYREIANVNYKPLSFYFQDTGISNILIPSIESLKSLETDYFTDENVEVWLQQGYIIYKVKNIVYYDENNELKRYNQNPIYLYHDSIGFSKIYGEGVAEEYYKILLNKYFRAYNLYEFIYNPYNKVESKDFLKFFNEQISKRTEINYKDADLKDYYTQKLKDGALIVLLNINSKKAEIYRNGGNEKLADKIQQKFLAESQKVYDEYSDKEKYNYSSVYFTDANNMQDILNGKRDNIFLNNNLQVDNSIELKENFVLFVRKGTVFETTLLDNYIVTKSVPGSNPKMQGVMVIYDCNNNQFVEPYMMLQKMQSATAFNNYFHKRFNKLGKQKKHDNLKYNWNFNNFYFNSTWIPFTPYKPCVDIPK
ncbi:MAG: hypothetical protein H6578_06005 [Chitinophagales bacterium]|nr:hypothetical protein [Chitinophagales bacterium]